MTKRIVLCADDFGQAKAISAGILALLARGRLSAVSCMVNGASWAEDARALAAFARHIDMGLHFNLTEGSAVSEAYGEAYGRHFLPLPQLLLRAELRLLRPEIVHAELLAQVNCFRQVMGFSPRFVDGHEHIQHLPVVRKAVVDFCENVNENIYIRSSYSNFWPFFYKKWIINLTGARAFKKVLLAKNIAHNPSFSGMYDFKNARTYAQIFPKFLQEVGENGLIMCHPGLLNADQKDRISTARYAEYTYFMSDQFLADCAKYQVKLSPLG